MPTNSRVDPDQCDVPPGAVRRLLAHHDAVAAVALKLDFGALFCQTMLVFVYRTPPLPKVRREEERRVVAGILEIETGIAPLAR